MRSSSVILHLILSIKYNLVNSECCNCLTPSAIPGCSQDIACQNNICSINPYCCSTSWDNTCSQYASNSCAIKTNVSCGDSISDISTGNWHYYAFTINSSYDVNFDSCNAVFSAMYIFQDITLTNIVSTACPSGNNCGNCNPAISSTPINFTVPSMKPNNKYIIAIFSSAYQINIQCSSFKDKCHYYDDNYYSIIPDQTISDSIQIVDNTIEIQFDIMLYNYCFTTLCNILYVGNYYGPLASISANGNTNSIELSFINEIYNIPNSYLIFPIDNQYHHVYLLYTPQKKIFTVDDVEYLSHYEDAWTSPSTGIYSLYLSRPWVSAIPGIVTNVCITAARDTEINCGETIIGSLTSSSDIEYYYFNLENETSVLFDSCDSSFFVTRLILYDANFNTISDKFYFGACNGPQTQLLVHSLQPGRYILGITVGYGQSYGDWNIKAICDYQTNIQGLAECGDVLKGSLNSKSDFHFYYFNLEKNSTVAFDRCNASKFHLFVTTFASSVLNSKYEGVEVCDNGVGGRSIYTLQADQYILEIYRWPESQSTQKEYRVGIDCHYVPSPPKYILNHLNIPGTQIFTQIRVDDAELSCENLFGTGLATIATERDMADAIEIIYDTDNYAFFQSGESTIWIGLYNGPLTQTKWQWIDGTCLDESTENCISDSLWGPNNPDIDEDDSQWRSGAYYDNISPTGVESDSSFSVRQWFLCNAPSSEYQWSTCNNSINCWKRIKCCNDSRLVGDFEYTLNQDLYFSYQFDPFQNSYSYQLDPFNNTYSPPVAFWKSKFFILGFEEIHYTNFKLLNTEFSWNSVQYYSNWSMAYNILQSIQGYSQYQSLVHLYDSYLGALITIDLARLDSDFIDFSAYPHESGIVIGNITCVVASDNEVYIVDEFKISIYEINTDLWSVSSEYGDKYFRSYPKQCSITNDFKFVYIFSFAQYANQNLKYDTESESFTRLSTINSCNCGIGKSITAPNNKIYFTGCYIVPFKTLIFNSETDKFETATNGVDSGTYPINFRKSQTTIFDDNILLLLHPISSNAFHTYYMITDTISINFTSTTSSNIGAWPSDGFYITYHLNDFNDFSLSNNVYYVWLNSSDTTSPIHEVIKLNVSNNGCICNNTIYNCYNCKQFFDLTQHLQLMDNDIDEIQFFISPYSINNQADPFILPEYVTISLQRCDMSFNIVNERSYSNNPMISFNYELSNNCYSRIGSNFSLDITSPLVNIKHELRLEILVNTTEICKICHFGDCFYCMNNYFEIQHDPLKTDATIQVFIASNSIDLRVFSSSNNFNIPFDKTYPFKLLGWHITLIVLGVLLIIASILGIIYCYLKNKKLKEEQTKYTYYVRHPMVICVGIAIYDDDAIKNAGIDQYCPNLSGIDRDYENINELCKLLKYDIHPKEEKYEWTEAEIKLFLNKCAKKVANEIDTLNDSVKNPNKRVNGYDSILFLFSGHGFKNNIITSDYQAFSKTAIHRMFSTNFPTIRDLPRIFVYDCCDGNFERTTNAADDDSDVGKNFCAEDIQIQQYEQELWKEDEKNPDFKLSTIHAANEGFMSKMSSINGSYLIYELIKRMMTAIENKQNLFFGEIVDSIQQYLHDQGKQQITSTFNNQTRYLKFIAKDVEHERNDDNVDIQMVSLINDIDKQEHIQTYEN